MTMRRRPMQRIGDLLPETARRLGLEDELRLARAGGTWTAIVAELVPAATGSSRLLRVERGVLLLEADSSIVAQELRLRAPELLAAFRAAPGGLPAGELAIRVRRPEPRV